MSSNETAVLLLAIQHVIVDNTPDPVARHADAVATQTLGATSNGVLIAGLALIVAVAAALFAFLAWRAAEKDLKYSKDNFAIVSRHPELDVERFGVDSRQSYGRIAGREIMTWTALDNFYCLVHNTAEGRKRSDGFFIEVIIPIEAFSKPYAATLLDEDNTKKEVVLTKTVHDLVLFPRGDSQPIAFHVNFQHTLQEIEIEVEYLLRDDYQDYPREGRRKRLLRLPTRHVHALVQPRDGIEKHAFYSLSAMLDPVGATRYMQFFEQLEREPYMNTERRQKKSLEILATV